MSRRFWIGLCCVTMMVACNSQHSAAPSEQNQGSSSGEAISLSDSLDWNLINTKVLNSCADCHSGSVSPTLVSKDDVVRHSGAVSADVNGDFMPPSGAGYQALTTCQKALLNEWLNQGGPDSTNLLVSDFQECQTTSVTEPPGSNTPPGSGNNNGGNNNGGTTPAEVVIDWNLINTRVLNSCASCHGSSYNTYKNASARVRTITRVTNSGYMPPRVPLSACQKVLLKAWSDAGTPMTTNLLVSDYGECANF